MSTEKADHRSAVLNRRAFLRLAGTGIAATALVGCVAPPPPQAAAGANTGAAAAPSKQVVTVQFATDWNAGQRFKVIEDARNIFEDAHPDIHIRMLHLSGGTTFAGGFADYIVPRFLTGQAPDLIYGAATFIYSHHDYLLDMTDALAAMKWDPNSTYDVYRSTHDTQGKQYAVPFNLFMSGWVYNKTLFESAGVDLPTPDWDWTTVLDKAKQLTDPSKNQYGVYVWNQWEYGYFPLMYSNGARFTDEGFTKTAFNTPEAAAALQWYIDLIYKEKVAPTPDVASSILASQVGDLFATGKIAMSPKNYSFDALNQQIGDRFEWGLIVPPKSPTTGLRGAYKGMEPLMASKETTARGTQDAALEYAMFLVSDEFQSYMSTPENRVSTCVNKKVVHGDIGHYLDAPPLNMKVVGEILDSDYIYDHPMFAKYGEFRQALWTPDRSRLLE